MQSPRSASLKPVVVMNSKWHLQFFVGVWNAPRYSSRYRTENACTFQHSRSTVTCTVQHTMKQERNIALNKLFLFETEYSDGFIQKILWSSHKLWLTLLRESLCYSSDPLESRLSSISWEDVGQVLGEKYPRNLVPPSLRLVSGNEYWTTDLFR